MEALPLPLDELDSNKKLWRETGYSDVPLLSSKKRNAFHPGLGERGTVTAFLKEEFLAGRCSQLKENARDLTLRLREGHVVR